MSCFCPALRGKNTTQFIFAPAHGRGLGVGFLNCFLVCAGQPASKGSIITGIERKNVHYHEP